METDERNGTTGTGIEPARNPDMDSQNEDKGILMNFGDMRLVMKRIVNRSPSFHSPDLRHACFLHDDRQ
jgi:hypothetical protein